MARFGSKAAEYERTVEMLDEFASRPGSMFWAIAFLADAQYCNANLRALIPLLQARYASQLKKV